MWWGAGPTHNPPPFSAWTWDRQEPRKQKLHRNRNQNRIFNVRQQARRHAGMPNRDVCVDLRQYLHSISMSSSCFAVQCFVCSLVVVQAAAVLSSNVGCGQPEFAWRLQPITCNTTRRFVLAFDGACVVIEPYNEYCGFSLALSVTGDNLTSVHSVFEALTPTHVA